MTLGHYRNFFKHRRALNIYNCEVFKVKSTNYFKMNTFTDYKYTCGWLYLSTCTHKKPPKLF